MGQPLIMRKNFPWAGLPPELCYLPPEVSIGSVNQVRAVKLNSALIQIQSAAELISMGFRGADRPRYWYSHGDFG